MIISQDDTVPSAMLKSLLGVLASFPDAEQVQWLHERLEQLSTSVSKTDFYLTYTLIRERFGDAVVEIPEDEKNEYLAYLRDHEVNKAEVARICLISQLLTQRGSDYLEAVKKLTEVADSRELITFLKYLYFLPHAGEFVNTAADALRTNIAPVFDAIALDNPYPARFFNEQQWNQMYLKAAFMQRPLLRIPGVEARANSSLSRIISDYAHERWAASRDIDPHIWKPVAFAPVDAVYQDMRYLVTKGTREEVKAAVLVAVTSGDKIFLEIVKEHQDIIDLAENKTLNWNNLKA